MTSTGLNERVVFGVCADPEPDKSFGAFNRKSSIVQADPYRPDVADLSEMQ